MMRSAVRPVWRALLGAGMSVASGCCCPTSFTSSGAHAAARSPASPGSPPSAAALMQSSDSTTQAEFHHVDFEVAPGIVLGIRYLRGEMVSTVAAAPVVFDDKNSFLIRIDTADVGLGTEVLNHLMNEYVFAYRGAPLRNLTFSVVGSQLRQRGILHKGVDIPFELTATLSVTPDGLIRVHPTSLKICSLDGTGLMRALRIELSDLIDLSKAKGAAVRGNDLVLDPNRLLPPPMIRGRLVGVRAANGQLIQSFGRDTAARSSATPVALTPPDHGAPNYMYFRGGTLRFGKLAMLGADMQIIDLDPSTPFAFNLDRYQQQLVAGYSKTGFDLSLRVFMPDYSVTSMSEIATP